MTDEAKHEAMIEAMARAICQSDHMPWEDASEATRTTYRRNARAAAEAIGLKPGCVVVDAASVRQIRDALDAAHWYVAASDRELSESGMTREEALGRFYQKHDDASEYNSDGIPSIKLGRDAPYSAG
jgi:hypothetical protein